MSNDEKPDTFGARATRIEDELAWIAYLAFNILCFIGLLAIAFLSMPSSDAPMESDAVTCERAIAPSPHEQQPEPIPAVMQGGIDVERWIL